MTILCTVEMITEHMPVFKETGITEWGTNGEEAE